MKSFVSTVAVSLLALTSAFAADNVPTPAPGPLSVSAQIASQAQQLQKASNDLAEQLKKSTDKTALDQSLAAVRQNSARLNDLVNQLASNPGTSSAEQVARVKSLNELLQIFVKTQDDLAAKADSKQGRSALRAESLGVARRAELIGASVKGI